MVYPYSYNIEICEKLDVVDSHLLKKTHEQMRNKVCQLLGPSVTLNIRVASFELRFRSCSYKHLKLLSSECTVHWYILVSHSNQSQTVVLRIALCTIHNRAASSKRPETFTRSYSVMIILQQKTARQTPLISLSSSPC